MNSIENFLNNPVYYALVSGNADMSKGSEQVKFFDLEVSPFAGFSIDYQKGFDELHQLLPKGRRILYATRKGIPVPGGWSLRGHIPGSQFLFTGKEEFDNDFSGLVPLQTRHVEQMVNLALLTKPGPFDSRTIEFGNYQGIFESDKLVAMTGRRLHVYDHIEVSAVCTHPDHLGKGYAAKLLKHQINSILAENSIPFLHVRSDNERAIALYKRLGFKESGDMHFYFLQKEDC